MDGSHLTGRMTVAKKPTGGKAFDDLVRKIVQVPKAELDKAERRYQKREAKRKKK
jgi:hypothetical protein